MKPSALDGAPEHFPPPLGGAPSRATAIRYCSMTGALMVPVWRCESQEGKRRARGTRSSCPLCGNYDPSAAVVNSACYLYVSYGPNEWTIGGGGPRACRGGL